MTVHKIQIAVVGKASLHVAMGQVVFVNYFEGYRGSQITTGQCCMIESKEHAPLLLYPLFEFLIHQTHGHEALVVVL